jgi:hypothetical protein
MLASQPYGQRYEGCSSNQTVSWDYIECSRLQRRHSRGRSRDREGRSQAPAVGIYPVPQAPIVDPQIPSHLPSV